MLTKRRLPLYTFLAVFLVLMGIGALTVPALLNAAQQTYYSLQADVNQRQVRAMTQFVASRMQAGVSQEALLREFQDAIEGTHTDRGYLCLIEQDGGRYLYHPDPQALGMPVKPDAVIDQVFDTRNSIPWTRLIKAGASGTGLLHVGPGIAEEIVHFASIPGTAWTISSHENATRVDAEIRSFRRWLVLGAIMLGLLIAGPASLAARHVSSRYEQQMERENELKHRLLEAEYARTTHELESARHLQKSMLPMTFPPHPRVALAASMQPASEIGGDYYDAAVTDEGTLTLAIGDATGHGARAGIMVTAMKTLFNLLSEEPDLACVLRRATVALKRLGLPRLYMALAVGRLNGSTLELIGAGMPSALIWRAATGSVETVPLKGMPLGSFVDFPYQKQCLVLAPGDTVLLMSDGFPECTNSAGEMPGYEQAAILFAAIADRPPQEIVERFNEHAAAWMNNHPQADDITFVAMKMLHA